MKRIAVVGSGIVGLSAARFLTHQDAEVTLFEQFELFHEQGSSHGRTRIVRRAYPDPFYTECMLEAYPLWADLERQANVELVNEVGLLYFGDRDADRVTSMQEGLAECNVPFEIFDSRSVSSVFPALRMDSNEIGIFTRQAGWVDAAGALQATYQLAIEQGLKLVTGRQVDLAFLEENFDAYVVAPGAWIRDWVDVPVRVTLETFGYAQLQVEGPVWIDDTDFAYGFPSDKHGLKLGAHLNGYETDAHEGERVPYDVAMELVRRKVKQRFGSDAEITGWTGCLYTATATEDFILGQLGSKGFFASACSGHGFKTAPWIGRLLSQFVSGERNLSQYPRFLAAGK